MTPALRAALGVLVGVALLAWLLPAVDLRRALATASSAPPSRVAGIVALTLLFLLLKAWRWQVLLGAMRAPAGLLLRSVLLGSALNYALPHAGEAARVALVQDGSRRPAAALLSSIGVERIMDLLVIALLAAVVAAGPGATVGGVPLAQLLLPVVTVAVALLAAMIAAPQPVLGIFTRMAACAGARVAALVGRHAADALNGLQALRSAGVTGVALLLSVAQWACTAACIALAMAAAGLAPSPSAVALTLVALVAGLLLPSAPGYAGTTQAAFVLALAPFGHDQASALAASLVYNVSVVATVLCAALPCALPWLRVRRDG